MSINETLTLAAYFFVLVILAVYGWHRYYLVYLYMRYRDREPKAPPPLESFPVFRYEHLWCSSLLRPASVPLYSMFRQFSLSGPR
jgi:hypothetical protein